MSRARFGSLALLFSILAFPAHAWALGMENFGNKPLNAPNFQEWPGIMPVVNHPSRVYHRWVNGNEHCYYQGDTTTLNEVLQLFAATPDKVHEIVLRPGPATAKSFDQTKTMNYNWDLHLVGGIAGSMAKRDKGALIWNPHPMLTIYTGGGIELERLNIPDNLTVLQLSDLEQRYNQGLTSTDRTVRGWSAGHLTRLNTFSKQNREAIARLLQDQENWVRLNAAGALASFGKQATSTLPALRAALKTDDERLKKRIEETIQTIEQAPDRAQEQKEFDESLTKIKQFCDTLKK